MALLRAREKTITADINILYSRKIQNWLEFFHDIKHISKISLDEFGNIAQWAKNLTQGKESVTSFLGDDGIRGEAKNFLTKAETFFGQDPLKLTLKSLRLFVRSMRQNQESAQSKALKIPAISSTHAQLNSLMTQANINPVEMKIYSAPAELTQTQKKIMQRIYPSQRQRFQLYTKLKLNIQPPLTPSDSPKSEPILSTRLQKTT